MAMCLRTRVGTAHFPTLYVPPPHEAQQHVIIQCAINKIRIKYIFATALLSFFARHAVRAYTPFEQGKQILPSALQTALVPTVWDPVHALCNLPDSQP